ncbi:MAG: hypothetical protein JWR72_1363 [Flavisolibacter sp.]|jgi:predicted nucleotidyltransferase|nr:hypothetical protein [Flavisolibacter sp.]
MDLFDDSFIELWQQLNQYGVKYILVGGFATNLHGYQRFTGDMDLYIEDTPNNRKSLRQAYKAYSKIDFEGFERIQFVPGWIDFPLNNGVRLDIMTSMKGVDVSFDECLRLAKSCDVNGVQVSVLHINHLIANKKAVGRPKDQLDVIYLEKIKKLREEEESATES